MKKTVLWVIVILVLVLVGYSLSQNSGSDVAEETGPIKVGFIAPLSEDAAVYGEPGRNVVALAIKEINEAGGVNGRMIEAIYEDGLCNGADATNAANKLINVDKVKIIIGGFCSSESLAVAPLAEAAGVLLLSPGSSSPDLTGIGQFFARTYPSDAAQGGILAEAAIERGYSTVAVMQEQTDYALGVHNAFKARFEELGGTITAEVFATETTDFRTPLAKLQAENPDALFVDTQTPAVAERILKQVSDLGWDPEIITNDVLAGSPEVIANNSELLEGAITAEFVADNENEMFQALLENYEAEYGIELAFQSYGQTEYDAVYLIARGIEEVGENPEALAKWIREVSDFEGASGNLIIGENGDRVGGHSLKVIENGEAVLAQ